LQSSRADAALAFGGGVTLVLLAVLQSANLSSQLNSDAVYPLVFAKDLAQNGTAVRWMVPPASGLFLDVPVVAALLALGFDGYANFTAWLAAFALMLAGAAWFFLESFGHTRRVALAVSFFCVAVLILAFPRSEPLGALYLSPDFHQSPMAGALLILGIQRRRWPARATVAALAALIGLGAASDPILIAQGVAPALLLWLRREDRRPVTLAGLALGTAAAFALRAGIGAAFAIRHGETGTHLTLREVAMSVGEYWAAFPALLEAGSLTRGALGVLCLVPLVWHAYRARGASLALLVATGLAVVAPLLAGVRMSPALYRQQLPLFFLPALGVVTIAAGSLRRFMPAVPALGVTLSVAVNHEGFGRLRVDPLLAREGEVVRRLAARGVDSVVATYWAAKPLWLHSRGRLAVCQVGPDAKAFPWIVDERWCEKGGPGLVAVVANAPWSAALEREFGPGLVENVEGYEIRYYRR
jgi:hypothetical protein